MTFDSHNVGNDVLSFSFSCLLITIFIFYYSQQIPVYLLKTIELEPNATTNIELIPGSLEQIHVGRINLGFAVSSPERVILACGLAGGTAYDSADFPPTNEHVTVDFACSGLTLRMQDTDGQGLNPQLQIIASYETIEAPIET